MRPTITFRVRLAWWLYPYCAVLGLFSRITGREPDWGKFDAMVKRAIKLERMDDE